MIKIFDTTLWQGKDVGDNSQFWKEAVVLDVERRGKDLVATVQFLHDKRVSKGHILN
jgi:hypothetical protein